MNKTLTTIFVLLLLTLSYTTQAQSSTNNINSNIYTAQSRNSRINVNVYGRTGCGYTRQMIDYLKSQKIPYTFHSVDDKKVSSKLFTQMRSAGVSQSRYDLPIVELNGKFYIQPKPSTVRSAYNRAR